MAGAPPQGHPGDPQARTNLQPSHVVKDATAAALAAYDNDPNSTHHAIAVGLLRAQGTHLGSEPGPEAA
jgi:hypothetical protein